MAKKGITSKNNDQFIDDGEGNMAEYDETDGSVDPFADWDDDDFKKRKKFFSQNLFFLKI